AKASNSPPPDEQIAQPRAKAIIEGHCLAAVRNNALRPHAGFLASATPSVSNTRRRDEQDNDLPNLLQGTQDIAGLTTDLPHAQPPQQRERGCHEHDRAGACRRPKSEAEPC